MSRLALIDPLTLMGREIAAEIARSPLLTDELVLFHTADNGEHQIAEIGGSAAIVPPLQGIAELAECAAAILACNVEGSRTEIVDELLETRPDLLFIDASSGERYLHLTSPAMDADGLASGLRLHLAHPAVVMAATVLQAFGDLGPEFLSLFAIDPVSVLGKDAIEVLARQAIQRLQGATAEADLGGQVLAFNIATLPSSRLTADACALLPGIEVAATRAMAGTFHGHFANLGIVFEAAVSGDEVLDLLHQDPRIVVAPSSLILNASSDRDDILITAPQISPDGRTVALTAIADGTRVGGALAAAAIIRGLT